jgi:hypothetical protein
MSLITKSATGSLSAKLTAALWPEERLDWPLLIAIVGGMLSTGVVLTEIVTELFASEPSILKFPDASENLLLATLITPLTVLLALGVKVAV